MEQEKSISLCARPGHLASSLPEVVVPRRGLPSRALSSSVDEDDDDLVFGGDPEFGDSLSNGFISERGHSSRKRGHLRDRGKRIINDVILSDGLINSPEQLFCYCRRPSFGKVSLLYTIGVSGPFYIFY